MQSAGYNMDTIRSRLNLSARNILDGTPLKYRRLSLLSNLEPESINKSNFFQFTPEHIIQNMDEDIAWNVFYRRMHDVFGDSMFDLQKNQPVFSYVSKPTTSVEQTASDFLTQKHPGFNFDPSMTQFTPAYVGQNIPTVELLRQRYSSLPFDFEHFN